MTIPECIAIIPDGNRRWADAQGLPNIVGHAKGRDNCETIARAAFDRGVNHVVIWAASTLNFRNRPKDEMAYLWDLLKDELKRRIAEPEDVRFRLRGLWRLFSTQEIEDLALEAEAKTAHFEERQLTVLFGYGGRADIMNAAKYYRGGGASEDVFAEGLITGFVSEIDLVIRTACRQDPEFLKRGMLTAHWSDSAFLWQMQKTELRFFEKFWPEFTVEDLDLALDSYSPSRRMNGH